MSSDAGPTRVQPEERTCGTCQSVRFTGPNELYQESGRCARTSESGRLFVQADDVACDHWQRRPKRRREAEAARRRDLAKIVEATNRRSHNYRRGK